MSAPLILISMSDAPANDERRTPARATLNAPYIEAVQRAGGVPLLVPPQASRDAIAALAAVADAALLTGGADIDPARYGEVPHPTVTGCSAARDAMELRLIELAFERDLPVLAVCRGMQLLNVALGGSLCQDIPSLVPGSLPHAQTPAHPRGEPAHAVDLTPGCRLACIMGADHLDVNSMHHQSVARLGAGLVAVGHAPDGVVEAAELLGRPVLAVQWHPEDLAEHHAHARALFAWLVETARGRPPL